jgi:DNA mismatch repair protein MutH
MNLPYDINDKDSIIDFAKRLRGNTLREVCDLSIYQNDYSDKGKFGKTLEKFYFLYEPNSDSEPDFAIAGLELKSTPLKQLQNKEYRSKERLVLNIINYFEVVNQDFETSSFWKKNANLLLICYLHQADSHVLDYLIKLVDDWSFPHADLEVIKHDWKIIKQKIADGKAHELSEGDTFYLGACTKGAKGGNPRPQPYCDTPAKQRAYSLKQGYVNHIIASISNETVGIYGKLISSAAIAKKLTIEEIVTAKFKPYYNKSIEQIIDLTGAEINPKAKHFYAILTKAILGIELDKEIEEFEKADIVVKTVRLKANNLPKEDISFPTFKYEEIVNEDWDDSDFKNTLEQKFLFVFFQYENKSLILKKVMFWNMPYADILQAQKVWERTKEVVATGTIVKSFKTDKNGKVSRVTNFPSKKFNSVAHVRPHATNSADAYSLPKNDKFSKASEYTKHCFWLNSAYVKEQIYLKDAFVISKKR